MMQELVWLNELAAAKGEIQEAICDVSQIIGAKTAPDRGYEHKSVSRIMEGVEVTGRRLGRLAIEMKQAAHEEEGKI